MATQRSVHSLPRKLGAALPLSSLPLLLCGLSYGCGEPSEDELFAETASVEEALDAQTYEVADKSATVPTVSKLYIRILDYQRSPTDALDTSFLLGRSWDLKQGRIRNCTSRFTCEYTALVRDGKYSFGDRSAVEQGGYVLVFYAGEAYPFWFECDGRTRIIGTNLVKSRSWIELRYMCS